MKNALALIAVLLLAGCSDDTQSGGGAGYPTGPLGPTEQHTILRGLVVDEDGNCIPRASVLITGQWGADSIEQKVPCALGNHGEDLGFTVEDVRIGDVLNIRTSAPGYVTQDQTVVPSLMPVEEVTLRLTRTLELRVPK